MNSVGCLISNKTLTLSLITPLVFSAWEEILLLLLSLLKRVIILISPCPKHGFFHGKLFHLRMGFPVFILP